MHVSASRTRLEKVRGSSCNTKQIDFELPGYGGSLVGSGVFVGYDRLKGPIFKTVVRGERAFYLLSRVMIFKVVNGLIRHDLVSLLNF